MTYGQRNVTLISINYKKGTPTYSVDFSTVCFLKPFLFATY